MPKIASVIIAMVVGVVAAAAGAEPLTPERLSAGPSLNGVQAGNPRPSPDGRTVAWLMPAADDANASVLWVMPSSGGVRRALIDSRTLGKPPVDESVEAMKARERRYQSASQAIDYRWTPGSDSVIVTFADDVFLVPLAGGSPKRLTDTPDTELDAQLSPNGRYASYVRGPRLFVRPVGGGPERAIGDDASESVFYGKAEFVAQEEMRRFTGQWWSPDGARIAYTRVDESKVAVIPRVLIDARTTRVANERYPLTGTPNAEVRLFVQPAAGGAAVEVDLGANRDIYLADAAWSRDGNTLYVLRQSRDQKRLDLLAADARTGATRVVLTEQSPTWVDLERDFRPLKDGSFLWGATRDGWRRLYLYTQDGRLIRQVTSGPWRIGNIGVAADPDFASLVGVDEAKGIAYVVASRETPIERQLYAVPYRAAGPARAITSGHGWWTPYMAADRPTGFVATYSDPQTPPSAAIYSLTGQRVAWLTENRLDASHPLNPYLAGRPSYDFGVIKAADGSDLHYVVVKPANFDPAKRYPAIVKVYGGPNVQTVKRDWHNVNEQVWTEAGYVLFQIDGRGGVNRDEKFEHALTGTLSGVNMEDQLRGIAWLRAQPYVDADRIGMMGWSFGAYSTVRMLTEPGSGIRAGAAGGTPTDFALYDTHYTERFLGTPAANPAGYAESGLLPRLRNLHGDLLLMHGLSDDNVVIANFTAAAAELQARGKLFETAVYPGMGHVPRGPYLLKSQLDFFARRLAPRR